MSKPHFIWAMRRTGGSSLTQLLARISEYKQIQGEPFNKDRIFSDITHSFYAGEDITTDLDDAFKKTPLIKHCYEIFNKEFNTLIVNGLIKQNYKHIFLIRENEVSRIMSLFLASQTGVWGQDKMKKYDEIIAGKSILSPFDIDKMIEQYELDQKITSDIKEMLTVNNKEYKIISFEDIYTGSRQKRLKNLQELFNFLEFSENTMHEFKDEIEKWIFNSSQDSKSILEYVPNYKEAIAELTKVSNTSQQSIKNNITNTLYHSYKSFINKIMTK